MLYCTRVVEGSEPVSINAVCSTNGPGNFQITKKTRHIFYRAISLKATHMIHHVHLVYDVFTSPRKHLLLEGKLTQHNGNVAIISKIKVVLTCDYRDIGHLRSYRRQIECVKD